MIDLTLDKSDKKVKELKKNTSKTFLKKKKPSKRLGGNND